MMENRKEVAYNKLITQKIINLIKNDIVYGKSKKMDNDIYLYALFDDISINNITGSNIIKTTRNRIIANVERTTRNYSDWMSYEMDDGSKVIMSNL